MFLDILKSKNLFENFGRTVITAVLLQSNYFELDFGSRRRSRKMSSQDPYLFFFTLNQHLEEKLFSFAQEMKNNNSINIISTPNC